MGRSPSCRGLAPRAAALGLDPMRPRPFRITHVHQETHDTFTMSLEPDGRRPHVHVPSRAIQHALRVRLRRGADLDERTARRGAAGRAHAPRGGAGHRAPPSAPRGRHDRTCADHSARRGRSRPARAPTSSSSPAASAWRRCGPRSTTCSPGGSGTDGSSCCSGRARRTTSSSRARSSSGGGGSTSPWR